MNLPSMSPRLARYCALGAALIWGSSFFILKDALDSLSPNYLLAIRFTLASLVLFAFCRKRMVAHLNARTVVHGLILGVLLFAAYCTQTYGLMYTTPGKNAFLTGVYCVLVPFFAWAFTRIRPTAINLLAAFLCLGGVGLVSLTSDLTIGLGDGLTLVCAVFYALHIATTALFTKGRDADADPLVLTVWQLLGVGVISGIAALFTETPPSADVWTPQIILTMAYLIIACTCVSLSLQNIGTKHGNPSEVALMLSMESPSGVFFSVIFAGEVLTGRLVIGFILIFIAILLNELGADVLAKLRSRFRTATDQA